MSVIRPVFRGRAARRPRRGVLVVGAALASCGGGSGAAAGTPTLTWYINPDNGGQADLAKACTKAADGEYRIDVQLLPTDADRPASAARQPAGGRRQLDRHHEPRPDPTFVPEFANVGIARRGVGARLPC
jgi:multiple sugar transport system substrate-binding protein